MKLNATNFLDRFFSRHACKSIEKYEDPLVFRLQHHGCITSAQSVPQELQDLEGVGDVSTLGLPTAHDLRLMLFSQSEYLAQQLTNASDPRIASDSFSDEVEDTVS